MTKTTWFRILTAIVLILLAINLAVQVPFIFYPFKVAVESLAPVLILGGVLYYILRPLVNVMKKKMPVVVSILLIFGLFTGLLALLIILVGPILANQVSNFVESAPRFANDMQSWFNDLMQQDWVAVIQEEAGFGDVDASTITDQLMNTLSGMGENIIGFLGIVVNVVTAIVVLPFVLFFLLKDGDRLPGNIVGFLPEDSRDEGRNILQDMDETLSAYIQGQAIVSVCVGLLSLIAYLIIGLDYALVLATIAMFTNLIPFIGPFIGTIPALIIALFESPVTALWVVVAIIIIQQIESNLISPNVMGHKLKVHPLTIILLLLVAGNLAGLIGLILAIPAYAVSKVILQNVYRLLKLRYPQLR
ncbi:putative PurR-regulated permease PerM [Salsuginibacillus halophilus]|uniref:Putative PurR-regulated permease PerM n=1 Tax=Salsuginibacillus halophilus TaxID=517424 RepID=A0A2P8HBE9_9BACI|nr:AI-2E family transporter [Salsuginibacillus halophilus]PSL43548.1 putative PurR-regulated permease PerM [Salsuginibacillus halophilus]